MPAPRTEFALDFTALNCEGECLLDLEEGYPDESDALTLDVPKDYN